MGLPFGWVPEVKRNKGFAGLSQAAQISMGKDAFLFLHPLACEPQEPAEKRFVSANFPYEIHYPANWAAKGVVGPMGGLDMFVLDPNAPLKTMVSVDAYDSRPSETLKEAVEDFVAQSKIDSFLFGIPVELVDISEPTSPDSGGLNKVGQYAAYRIRSRNSKAQPPVDLNAVVFIAEDLVWNIILTTHENQTGKQFPIFRQMLNSFKPKPRTLAV